MRNTNSNTREAKVSKVGGCLSEEKAFKFLYVMNNNGFLEDKNKGVVNLLVSSS